MKWIAYIGSSRLPNRQIEIRDLLVFGEGVVLGKSEIALESDGHTMCIEADTEEEARHIAAVITDRLWPEADGWLRPARLSLSRLLDFLALRPHTAENLGEWQNE